MKRAVKSPRKYDASRRQEQARATRLAVIRVAQKLFVEQGYGRTTMNDIAAAAGVSVEMVYANFRNKPTLLHHVWDITIGGDDEEVVFHERPEVKAIRAEPDLAKRLKLHAAFSTQTARRIAPFLLALHGAAASEPSAAAMLEEIGRQRLAGLGVMAAEAAKTGQLAVPEEECRDVLWALTDGMLWHRLVSERGWTDERFAAWLGEVWAHMLVQRPTRKRPTASG
ncbi:MAG: TetR family transcriptional regulator [Actinomycetes bacterium]